MSLAVSAVISSSRLLRVALAVYGTASAGAALALVTGQGAPFYHRPLLAGACLAAALVALRCAGEIGNARRIDISGLGEIRLSVQQSLGAAPPHTDENDHLVELLPGSTIWPCLLILRLRSGGNGAVTVVTILPDSVSAGQFRKVAAAVTWIARRDNKFSQNNKIL